MTDPTPEPDAPAQADKPDELKPGNYAWLAASIGIASALLGAPLLALACYTAMAVWVAATIKLGLEISLPALLAAAASLVVVLALYGAEQLWLLMRGRFKRNREITLTLKTVIIAEHALFLGILVWLLFRVVLWVRELQAGTY